ncbi:MAG: hypothetical protein L3V56_02340 [Candidatus Magnetoovum sp. WYHC-5]|nr:hypothetical protein [Candidatus Magnetoovum sp. WYHC-5]
MAEIADDRSVDVKLRAKLYMELAQYVYAKKKTEATADEHVEESYEERLLKIRGLEMSEFDE